MHPWGPFCGVLFLLLGLLRDLLVYTQQKADYDFGRGGSRGNCPYNTKKNASPEEEEETHIVKAGPLNEGTLLGL